MTDEFGFMNLMASPAVVDEAVSSDNDNFGAREDRSVDYTNLIPADHSESIDGDNCNLGAECNCEARSVQDQDLAFYQDQE